MTSYVSHLECAYTGQTYDAQKLQTVSNEGKPLLVKYNLDVIRKNIQKKEIENSTEPGFWRYSPLLPVEKASDRISLGEVITPLISLKQSAKSLGAEPGKVLVKDESRLPTGSFKARGLALAVSMAKQFGVEHIAIPTNGNAGAALASYASRGGIRTTVLCPDDTPEINILETKAQGGDTYLVNGLIGDCGKIINEGSKKVGWFAVSTLREPYRIEGKKTMGLELAEQMEWDLPEVIFYPTGGGTGLIGMWKAFSELTELGWIKCKLPRMIAVQSTGCSPIVKAWKENKEFAAYWENAETYASGIRVPSALGDFLMLKSIRESNGFAIAVSDEETKQMVEVIGQKEGFLMCPEGATTAVAYKMALNKGLISAKDRAVLFNTATGLKYPMPQVTTNIDKNIDVDYQIFVS